MEQGHQEAPAVMRRKRKVARAQREKTPEASKTGRKLSDEGSSSTAADYADVQNVNMQLRPPGAISSHKSKILSRRNKSFTGAVARSSSTPRQDNNVSTEVYDFLRVARRSLSSPRHKEETSESGQSTSTTSQLPVLPVRTVPPQTKPSKKDDATNTTTAASRLQMNLQKFEEERRKFEQEKKKFEREKRELSSKMRYKHLDTGDRNRITEIYRRLSDRIHLPSDTEDKQLLIAKFLENQNPKADDDEKETETETEKEPEPDLPDVDYESSTASSTGRSTSLGPIDADETDADDEENPQPPITREKKSMSRNSLSGSPRQRFKKKDSETDTISTTKLIQNDDNKKTSRFKGFFSRIFFPFSKKRKLSKPKIIDLERPVELKDSRFPILRLIFIESRQEWKNMKAVYPAEVEKIRVLRNKCFSHLIIFIIFCGFGGFLFRFCEGAFENMYKCGVRRVKRDFIDQLWLSSHNMREEDWKSSARMKLRKFEEELHTAHESGMTSYSGMKSWNFVNSVYFCMTVLTTIGYGHITPITPMGRTITIIYAIFGIPIFLILLADFGKLFTRGIKFLWAFVRRLYYTGSCRKIRKQTHVAQMMQGMNIVYEIAVRRPSAYFSEENIEEGKAPPDTGSALDTPTSPPPETYLIDDEFNLPISVAITVLLLYIFLGAFVYCMWEDWSYFESFYFVFISMSTIGFGDYVPKHPIFMMASIAYLVFGLALTSMCINVVQVKLSDSFKMASSKIGATIGLSFMEEDAQNSQNQTPSVEIASVHTPSKPGNPITQTPPPVPRRSPNKNEDNKQKNNK